MKTDSLRQNIPSGWQEKSLGDICDIVNGSTPKRTVSEYWENGNIPWFTVEDIRSSGRIINKTNQSITEKALKETSVKLLPEDSVLLCCTASLGEVAFTKIPLTTNQQFNGLVSKDKENLYPYYLFYSAQKLGESLKSKSGKTTISFLSVGTLSKEKILLPPLEEQQKIAEILGTVDEDIAKTQELIDTTEKLKKGLMQELFTRGIGHTKFKETKIGPIPEEWTIVELGNICDVRDGTHNSPKYYEKGYPLITSKNLIDNKLDFNNVSLISETDFLEIEKRSKVDEGDILFGMIGTIGNPVIVRKDRDFAIKNVALIKFYDESVNNKFILNFLKSNYTKTQFDKKKGGSTQKFIALGVIRKILVILPKIEEQQKIAGILSSIDEKISVNKKLKEKLITLKKGLMQDLLSGRVRVNIN